MTVPSTVTEMTEPSQFTTTRLMVPSTVPPAPVEGQDLSAMPEIWEELARTEMRLQLMSDLIQIKVGFADVEEFNLDLKGNLKNPISGKIDEMQDKKGSKSSNGNQDA